MYGPIHFLCTHVCEHGIMSHMALPFIIVAGCNPLMLAPDMGYLDRIDANPQTESCCLDLIQDAANVQL